MIQDVIFEAVIFDMDGVVIDSKEVVDTFWMQKAAEYHLPLTLEEMDAKVHGRPARQTINRLLADYSEEVREKVFQECELYERDIPYPAIPGVVNFLQALHKNKVPVALVTSSTRPKTENVIKRLGLGEIFRTVVTFELITNGKPDPECYRLGAQKLGISPASCLVFEDALSGMQAAIGAGMTGIGVNSPKHIPALLAVGASAVIPDFTAVRLAGAENGFSLHLSEELQLKVNGPTVRI